MTCQCPNETSNTCKYLDVSVSVGVFHGFCQLSLSVSWPVSRWRPGQKRRAASHKRRHVINSRLRVLLTCPERLRLSPGLPSPTDTGLWQLTQGSWYSISISISRDNRQYIRGYVYADEPIRQPPCSITRDILVNRQQKLSNSSSHAQ